MLDVIEKKIQTAEKYISSGAIDQLDGNIADRLRGDLLAYSKLTKFSEEQMKALEKRINEIEKAVKENEISKTSTVPSAPKYLLISKEKLDKVRSNSAKGFTAGVLATLGIVVFMSCNGNKNNVETNEYVIEATTETELPELKEEPTSMSEEMKVFSDTTVKSIDDALEAGINLSLNEELTETDKETYARILTQYRIVANMDDLTKLEYAELFGEIGDPTEDLVESFFEYNTSIKKHLITITSSNMLDYSNLYDNEKDAEVLNQSERLIVNINEAKDSNEKLEASKAWYSYVINILTSNEGNIALSSQALDTLITHSEAYDELTRSSYSNIQGAHIDDELEHYFNTAKNTCLNASNESELDVEEVTIENLKSVFRISFIEKLGVKYEDALAERTLQLTLENPLNKYNSFNEVVDYVKNKIDLTKYVKLEIDYIEKQKEEKGINAPAQKSKDDSGISNGNGGNISKSDMIQHNATTKEEYEQKVIEETNRQSSNSEDHVISDPNGNIVSSGSEADPNEYNLAVQAGASARNNGSPRLAPEGLSNNAKAGWYLGWDQADLEIQKAMSNSSSETTYEPVENGEITYTESEESYQDYTETVPVTNDDIEYNTTFEPIDQASAFSVQSELEELRNMRDKLLSVSFEEENSKTLS